MISIDVLKAYLKQQIPNMDWGATLAGLGQLGGEASEGSGAPVIPTSTPEIAPIIIPPTTVPTSSTPAPDEPSPKGTASSETSKPSPKQPQIEPLNISPLSAYHDPGAEDEESTEGERAKEEKKIAEGKGSEEGGDKSEKMPVNGAVEKKEMTEEEQLNETTKKQGFMTDDEFQSILDGVTRREENAAEMDEGLDLASKAVGDSGTPEPTRELEDVAPQLVAGAALNNQYKRNPKFQLLNRRQ